MRSYSQVFTGQVDNEHASRSGHWSALTHSTQFPAPSQTPSRQSPEGLLPAEAKAQIPFEPHSWQDPHSTWSWHSTQWAAAPGFGTQCDEPWAQAETARQLP